MKKWGLLGIILLQSLVYLLAGANKSYFHMDEIYSYGLANSEQVQIYDAPDFYGQWHTGDYYAEYVTVSEGERGQLTPVYTNQRDDVHPPLYYLLTRGVMELAPGVFSKWLGIGLNIIILALNTVVIYAIVGRFCRQDQSWPWKQLLFTLAAGLTIAAVSTAIFIRMYALLTLMVSLTTWLHLQWLDQPKNQRPDGRLLAGLVLVVVAGGLTQYYYWFYLATMVIFMVAHYVRRRAWRGLVWYVGTVVVGGVLSLAIFPYAIQHMFFGYRGQGAMSSLLNLPMMLGNLWQYVILINQMVFHDLLPVLVLLLAIVVACAWRRKKLKDWQLGMDGIGMVSFAVLGYFVIVAAASPFLTIRYVAPVCGLGLILLLLVLDFGLRQTLRAGWRPGIIGGILLLWAAMPLANDILPDTLYLEHRETVTEVSELSEAPAIYVTEQGADWAFLNDIVLMIEIEDSYMVQDTHYTETDWAKVLGEQDLADGLLVFINGKTADEGVLEVLEPVTGLQHLRQLKSVSARIYYLY